jgi:hypothetical protein
MEFAIDHPNRGTFAQDEDGMDLAYHDVNHPTAYDPDKAGTYYNPSTIRGPVTKQDWYDDVAKVPAWGDSRRLTCTLTRG